MTESTSRRLWFLDALLIAGAAAMSWANRQFVEDAYISLRYARHFAEGSGLVWNPGFEAVEGYTNFLWVLLMSGVVRLGLEPEPVIFAAGVASLVGLLLVVRWLARRLFGESLTATATLAVVAANATLLAHSSSGLETSLAALLCLSILAIGWSIYTDGWSVGRGILWVVVASLAVLTRMDCALAVGFSGLIAGMDATREGDRPAAKLRPGRLLVLAAPVAAVLGAWIAWRLSYYGDWVPNTAHIKSVDPAKLEYGLWYVGQFIDIYALLLPAGVVLLSGAVSGGLGALRRGPTPTRVLVGALASYAILHTSYITLVGGGYLGFRLLASAIPAMIIGFVYALDRTLESTATRGGFVIFFVFVSLQPLLDKPNEDFHWRQDDAPLVSSMRRAGEVLGEPFSELPFAERPTVAVVSAGALPYFSRLPAYDLLGLNTPDVRQVATYWPHLPAGHRWWVTGDQLVDQRIHFFAPGAWTRPRDDRQDAYTLSETFFGRYPGAQFLRETSPRIVHIPYSETRDLVVIYLNPEPRFTRIMQRLGYDFAELRFPAGPIDPSIDAPDARF